MKPEEVETDASTSGISFEAREVRMVRFGQRGKLHALDYADWTRCGWYVDLDIPYTIADMDELTCAICRRRSLGRGDA